MSNGMDQIIGDEFFSPEVTDILEILCHQFFLSYDIIHMKSQLLDFPENKPPPQYLKPMAFYLGRSHNWNPWHYKDSLSLII